jgi:hypothetical protein
MRGNKGAWQIGAYRHRTVNSRSHIQLLKERELADTRWRRRSRSADSKELAMIRTSVLHKDDRVHEGEAPAVAVMRNRTMGWEGSGCTAMRRLAVVEESEMPG